MKQEQFLSTDINLCPLYFISDVRICYDRSLQTILNQHCTADFEYGNYLEFFNCSPYLPVIWFIFLFKIKLQ
jgi:hypothetical protein